MSKNAWISVGVFAVLLALVLVTREDQVAVGMRNLSLPAITTDAVTKIELGGKQSAVLEKGEGGWTVADPSAPEKRYAAEASAVQAALDALGDLSATGFVTARKAKHAELEIDREQGLAVTVHQQEGAPLSLVLGRSAKGGGNYLRLAGADEVFIGQGGFGSVASKDVKGWRKRKLVDAAAEDLKQITVGAKDGSVFTAMRKGADGGSWGLMEGGPLPDGFRLDTAALGRLASTFVNLRAADFAGPEVTLEAAGLKDQTTAGGGVGAVKEGGGPIQVRFGHEDEQGRVYAQLEGDTEIYLVAAATAASLTKPLVELRDLTLASFDVEQAVRLSIEAKGERVVAEKQDGAWSLTTPAPPGFDFDATGLSGRLTALARLKGTRRLDDAPPGTGLERPEVVVTVTLEDGSEKRLAFGRDAPPREAGAAASEVYVRGAEEDNVYLVGKWQKGRYEKPFELLKKPDMPPPGQGGPGGGMQGLDQLPPEVRKQLEEAMRKQGMGG